MSTVAAYTPPEIPSKWEIIPVHNSDLASFKRCRRYWNWNSPARANLQLRADIHGVNTDLWFGTGIHWALEKYYTPGLRRDPVESWKTWYDIQWRGGIVTAEWLPLVYDLKPQEIITADVAGADGKLGAPHSVKTWRVRGLEDIIPSPDHEKFDELYELGVNMMIFYKEYAEAHDDFNVILTEHDFSVPIWDYERNEIMTRIDTREESPNYGNVLEVHARGRVDNVWTRGDKLGIIDYKTAKSIDEDYHEKLETDEQCTRYLWALEVEANYYGLPHQGVPIEEVLYIALRKTYPRPPTMLKNGMFSVSRTDESTTYEMLQDFIRIFMPGIPLNEKQQAYVDWVKEQGEDNFIVRTSVRRNRHQIANMGYRTYLEARDMLNPDILIYPNITNDWLCKRCVFRAPCLASEDGGDVDQLINDNYTSARDR